MENLFNTFSYDNWSTENANNEAEELNKKRRKKQVKKLKDYLKKRQKNKTKSSLGDADMSLVLSMLSQGSEVGGGTAAAGAVYAAGEYILAYPPSNKITFYSDTTRFRETSL